MLLPIMTGCSSEEVTVCEAMSHPYLRNRTKRWQRANSSTKSANNNIQVGESGMRHPIAVLIVLLFCGNTADAQDASQVEALNAAWQTYVEAIKSGEADVQIEAARNALKYGQEVFPENDGQVAVLMSNYGLALLAGKQQDEARDVLKASIRLTEEIHGNDSIELIAVLANYADAVGGVGYERRQLKYYNRALKISAAHHGENSLEYANLAYRAAKSIFNQSNSRIGRRYMVAAQQYYASLGDVERIRNGVALHYLGTMEYWQRDYKNAVRYLLEALEAFDTDDRSAKENRMFTRALLIQAYESWGKTEMATEHVVAIGKESMFSPNQDYRPLFRLVPRYPAALLRRGIEGYVDVSFTIDENGFVKNPMVIYATPSNLGRSAARSRGTRLKVKEEDSSFDAAALAAVKRFRYAPRFVDGQATSVANVKTRLTFRIAD